MRRPSVGATLLVAALALFGCGDDDATGEVDGGTTTTLDPSWSPPGTEIGLGLTVPDGAHLAGPVFHRPQQVIMEQVQPDGDELEALLVIEDDPFGVFDAVAEQVRALGPEMNGSASSCGWWDLSIDPDHGGFSVERLGPVSDPPPDEASALQCETSAVDSELSVTVVLRWGEGLPGSLFVTASAHVSDIALEDYVSTPGSPDAASAEAMAAVPEAAPPDQPDVGDPFGGSGNCLSSGYDQMRLPSDSRLVGTEGGPDGRSVLATDDAEAAMAALTESSLGGSGGDLPSPPEDLVLADGTSVRTQGFSISGGGGACELLSSPDGRHVLVTMHSD